jgi:hypothetical protein
LYPLASFGRKKETTRDNLRAGIENTAVRKTPAKEIIRREWARKYLLAKCFSQVADW